MSISALTIRLNIGTRILAGFLLVLLLLGSLGAVGVFALKGTERLFATYGFIGENTIKATTIDRNFVELQRNVVLYVTSGDERALARARELASLLGREATSLHDVMIVAERKALLQPVIGMIQQYAANFEAAVKLRVEREKTVKERLTVAGQAAAERLGEIIKNEMAEGHYGEAAAAGQTQDALLKMQLDAFNFLSAPDPKIVENIKRRYDQFRITAAGLPGMLADPDRQRLATETNELSKSYFAVFKEIAQDTFELDKLVNTDMSRQSDAIAEAMATFIKAQRGGLASTQQQTSEGVARSTMQMTALAVCAFFVGLLAAYLIARSINRPVKGMTAAMAALAQGNLDIEIPSLDHKDEIGDMAKAVQVFKDNALRVRRMEAEQREAEHRAAEQRRTEMLTLADRFDKAVGGIVETVSSASTELEAAAGTLTKTAETTQHLSTAVAAASEQASTNVQAVASATNEMTSSVGEISRQVQEFSRIANEAVSQAQKTDARITELSQAAARIGDVVKLITAIAEQTNLLALNATIEAARAGEAGKGFAVVAQEVKALAAQTAKATDEIGAQISGMQAATQESVGAIKEIGGTIGRIAEIASTIAAAVEEQGAATQEIARNIQQAAAGTTQVASNITEVNRGAGETGSASSQVLSSAQSLSQESSRLKLEVDRFLATVRAA